MNKELSFVKLQKDCVLDIEINRTTKFFMHKQKDMDDIG